MTQRGESVLITLPIAVRGTMRLKAGAESNPCVTLSTDDYERTSMARVPLVDDDDDQWQEVELQVRVASVLRLQQCRDHLAAGQLSVAGVVNVQTPIGLTARKNAGFAKLSLAQLFAQPLRVFKLSLCMNMLTDRELQCVEPKGTVEVRALTDVRIRKLSDTAGVVGERLVSLGLTHEQADALWQQRDAQRKSRMHELRALMSAWSYLFEHAPHTFPAARNINCYTLRLDDTTMLPSVAYMLQPPPSAIDLGYYENALDIVSRRESLTNSGVAQLPLESPRLATVAVQMLCAYANYAPYASDEGWVPVKTQDDDAGGGSLWARVRGNASAQHLEMKKFPMEEFEIAELYGSDDCEGVGFLIVRLYLYLMSIADTSSMSDGLRRVRELLQLYVPLLLLCGVTSADLGSDFAALTSDSASMGAHMFALFVPLGRVLRMIARCNLVENPFPPQALDFEMAAAASIDLPLLCGEGTGLLTPLPLNLPERKELLLPPPPPPSRQRRRATVSYDGLLRPPLVMDHYAPTPVSDARGMRPFVRATGSANPVFTVNSLFITDLMQAVHAKAFSHGVRKWYHITDRGDVSPHFYRTVQLAMTPTFVERGINLLSLVFMQRRRDGGSDEPWSIGCTFSDLFEEGNPRAPREVAAWPETPPDATEYAHMLDEMRREPRPPVLHPPPAQLGINNTWDPTALVPTVEQHAAMQAAMMAVHEAAVLAEIHTMRHAIEYSEVSTFVGTPHLMSGCRREREIATRLLGGDGGGLDTLLKQYRDAMLRTSLSDGDTDRRRPLVAEFALNYQQLQQRAAAMTDAVQVGVALRGAVVLPAGFHVDWEHVTADTGGAMVRLYTLVQY